MLRIEPDDAQARLLAQALNRIHGADDLGLRAELLRQVLKTVPETEILSLLPETKGSLSALTSMNQDTMAEIPSELAAG